MLAEREELFNRLLDKENKILVVIDLTKEDDEQSIFDTINSAGVHLSAADVIKNSLFQKAMELFGNGHEEEVIDSYRMNWEAVFSKD